MRGLRRTLLGGLLAVTLATTLYAATGLPRDALRHVELTCMLDHWVTASALPCLSVDSAHGVVVLRAPLEDTHVVVMPTASVSGVEAPLLRRDGGPNYFQAAWDARSFVQGEVARPLGWDDVGLAINSRSTRSQDQLHIHVDCVDRRVKRALAASADRFPTDRWLQGGLVVHGHPLWVRLVDAPSLTGTNLFRLSDDIPGFAADPAETTLAAFGVVGAGGRRGFAIVAGQSDPARAASQFTGEHLLDHACRVS